MRRRGARRADRLTLGLATVAVGTAGTVIAGEVRAPGQAPDPARGRRRRSSTRGPSAPRGAGRATQDTVAVLVEGYEATSRTEKVLFNMLTGFVSAFALIRLSTAGIRGGWWPAGNVRLGGRHIHHFVPGHPDRLRLGALALLTESPGSRRALAVPFGAGIGLTFDEAALLLDLRDVYWTREGILSVQVSLGLAATLGGTILALRMLRRGEERVEAEGRIPPRLAAFAGHAGSGRTARRPPPRARRRSSGRSTSGRPTARPGPSPPASFGAWVTNSSSTRPASISWACRRGPPSQSTARTPRSARR